MRGLGFADPTPAVRAARTRGRDAWVRFAVSPKVPKAQEPKAVSFWVNAPRENWMGQVMKAYVEHMKGSQGEQMATQYQVGIKRDYFGEHVGL